MIFRLIPTPTNHFLELNTAILCWKAFLLSAFSCNSLFASSFSFFNISSWPRDARLVIISCSFALKKFFADAHWLLWRRFWRLSLLMRPFSSKVLLSSVVSPRGPISMDDIESRDVSEPIDCRANLFAITAASSPLLSISPTSSSFVSVAAVDKKEVVVVQIRKLCLMGRYSFGVFVRSNQQYRNQFYLSFSMKVSRIVIPSPAWEIIYIEDGFELELASAVRSVRSSNSPPYWLTLCSVPFSNPGKNENTCVRWEGLLRFRPIRYWYHEVFFAISVITIQPTSSQNDIEMSYPESLRPNHAYTLNLPKGLPLPCRSYSLCEYPIFNSSLTTDEDVGGWLWINLTNL